MRWKDDSDATEDDYGFGLSQRDTTDDDQGFGLFRRDATVDDHGFGLFRRAEPCRSPLSRGTGL